MVEIGKILIPSQARMSKDVKSSLKLLDGLPPDQKSLLEEALNNGEIDNDALAPAIKYSFLIVKIFSLSLIRSYQVTRQR